jgi:hypothetical protein
VPGASESRYLVGWAVLRAWQPRQHQLTTHISCFHNIQVVFRNCTIYAFSENAYLLHLLLFLRSIVLGSFMLNHGAGYVDCVSVSSH